MAKNEESLPKPKREGMEELRRTRYCRLREMAELVSNVFAGHG
jgi:hypothetical protein